MELLIDMYLKAAAAMLGKNIEDCKIITCHLGNGASVAAIDGGKSVDTSMGFTPLEGLIMGTRCGDIDAAILPFLMEKEGLDAKGLSDLMNKKSGSIRNDWYIFRLQRYRRCCCSRIMN